MALAAIFGRRKTPEELLRQNQRALTKVSYQLSGRTGCEAVDVTGDERAGQGEDTVRATGKEVSGGH